MKGVALLFTKHPQITCQCGDLVKSFSVIIMSNFLTPIKALLDMDVKTKSTYRAALEGLDISMDQILNNLAYDPHCQDKNPVQLYRNPTDFRLDAAQKRLAAFATNKEIGLVDYVKYARNVMHDFLDVIKLGHLHDMHMDNTGCFNITISCLIWQSGLENNASNKKKFEDQLKHLDDMGLTISESRGVSGYQIDDTDSNRNILIEMLSDRGATLIKFEVVKKSIRSISFHLFPTMLHRFIENPTNYTLPVTEELNDDEMSKLKKLVNEIPSSLAFIKESHDMVQTCGFVAESCFAEIEEICGFDGNIFKRVKERHAKERAANMSIHDIEKEIGSQFPAEIARNTMEKISATMAYFCVANLHATCSDLKITEWGTVSMDIRINQRGEDLRYCYYFDDTKYNEPYTPTMDDMESACIDVVKNRNSGIRWVDNENNRNTVASFVKCCDFYVDSISVVRDDCYVTRTRYGQEETSLENIFVINTITVSADNIDKILELYEKCGVKKV